MAIELPNGKISRTLPEQVGFNSKKIEEIIKAINDFELVDKVIDLDSASGVLTDTQFGIAELSPSFILYSGKVFTKAFEDGTNIDFIEVGALAGGSTTLTLSVERFRVTVSTKAYQYAVVQLFESYTKTQIDTLLAAKAALSGANFTGPITASSIIENMGAGYSYLAPGENDPTQVTLENLFCGIVKNGNKLTIVCFTKITRLASITTGGEMVNLGVFTVPKAVGNKLYPEESNRLSSSQVYCSKDYHLGTTLPINIYKNESTSIDYLTLRLYDCNSLTLNTPYYCRVEATFLLSDNLAQ